MTDVVDDKFVSSMWNRFAVTSFAVSVALWVLTVVATGWVFVAAAVGKDTVGAGLIGLSVWFAVFTLFSVAPVVFGHVSLLRARADLRGRRLGVAGTVLGYGGVVVGLLSFVVAWVFLIAAAAAALLSTPLPCSPHCSW